MYDRLRNPHPRLLPTPLSDPPIVHEERKLLVRSAEGTLVQVTEHEMGKLLEGSRLPQEHPRHIAPPVDPELQATAEALVKDAMKLKRILAARNGHQVRGVGGRKGRKGRRRVEEGGSFSSPQGGDHHREGISPRGCSKGSQGHCPLACG